ncbi:hypothetical protein JYU34_011339 [Plutella xylostella]|uniref:Uncharacterized protein n=1 Tax=Plutella xylostella TaxID=51655 RepID=A0ABQ7QHJ8_PLUXY|nr:hypothetical protein JYU34_011339 [Plutella xylostella]
MGMPILPIWVDPRLWVTVPELPPLPGSIPAGDSICSPKGLTLASYGSGNFRQGFPNCPGFRLPDEETYK